MKRPSLNPVVLDNYQVISSLSLWGKLLKCSDRLISQQPRKVDYVAPFQSEFRPSLGIEVALISLLDDMHQDLDRESWLFWLIKSLDIFWYHQPCILLDHWWRLGFGGFILQWLYIFLGGCNMCWWERINWHGGNWPVGYCRHQFCLSSKWSHCERSLDGLGCGTINMLMISNFTLPRCYQLSLHFLEVESWWFRVAADTLKFLGTSL